jgi:glycosyltransferase involved in cell wall biosynthesis
VLDLARFDNVHLLGVRPYDQLQGYLRSFDVAIVPHLDDAMTRVMNPLKVFVYCAANVPVVSTAVGNMEEMRALVRVATDHDDFIGAVDEAIRRGRGTAPSAEQTTLLEANSWPRRVDEVLALVEARLQAVGAP